MRVRLAAEYNLVVSMDSSVVVHLLSDSDDDEAPAEAKRTLASVDINVATSSKRSKSLPTSGVIDLEAENGVGKGVSGKPLLPGELEARQQRVRHMWTLRASRSTEDTPEEQHYRFAESAWCRGGGQAAEIGAIEYHFHPTLEARWHAKKAEYDELFGVGGHTIIFAFHGTRKHNVVPILDGGFKVSKVGSTTDAGYYGAGIYCSEQLATSRGYNSGNDGMFLCKLLVGKPFLLTRVQNGCSLKPGYTSHVNNRLGSEVVIFDDAAMLPIYRVKLGSRHQTEPLKGLEGDSSKKPVSGAVAGSGMGYGGADVLPMGLTPPPPKPWHATAELSKAVACNCRTLQEQPRQVQGMQRAHHEGLPADGEHLWLEAPGLLQAASPHPAGDAVLGLQD